MKKPLLITYISLGAVTLGAFVPLTVWAASGNSINDVEIIDAKLVLQDNVRLEYLEKEELDLTGITMVYGNNKVAQQEELTINYDFSKAGTRVVEFVKEAGNKHYRALLPVTVYHIRHLDIRDATVMKNEDGTWDNSRLTVWAELNEPAKSFDRPEGFEEYQTVVSLRPEQYTFSVSPTSKPGRMAASIYAGYAEGKFVFYDPETFDNERKLTLINQTANGDKLTLFVEDNSADYAFDYETDITVTGVYVYETEQGVKYNYSFFYNKPANSWDSHFRSNEVDWRVSDAYGCDASPEGYHVVINGTTFYALPNQWHGPILGIF